MDINVLELFYADAVALNKPLLPDFCYGLFSTASGII